MSGIANTKLTLAELQKLQAYALRHRIEPQKVPDTETAKLFNDQEKLFSRLLGVPIYHTWKMGDRFYGIPLRPIHEEDSYLGKAGTKQNNNLEQGRSSKNAGKKKRGVAEKAV